MSGVSKHFSYYLPPDAYETPISGVFVSKRGLVWSAPNTVCLYWRLHNQRVDPFGYVCVGVWDRVKKKQILTRVHRLVCRTFHGEQPSEQHEVRHLDGDKLNNVAANLAWGLHIENMQDRKRHGKYAVGVAHFAAKLTDEKVREILLNTESLNKAARRYGVSKRTILNIRHRRVWKHVEAA